MSLRNKVEMLHKVRVRLYPSYLPQFKGKFIARTDNEKTLSIEDICASLKQRGGFTGSYEELVNNVKRFYDESMYKLCDGFAINTGYYSIQPVVEGTFDSTGKSHSRRKNPISFRFHVLPPMRCLVEYIKIEIQGLANPVGSIARFTDIEEDSVNGIYVPGNLFRISGHNIKIAGDDPSNGVYFVPLDDSSKAVKTAYLGKNTSTAIISKAPKTGFKQNKIEILTQYEGSTTKFLKAPRTISSNFTIEECEPR
jgi:hypothetical protein